MNDQLVVYSSKSGFTRRYAEWIAEELQCEAIPLSNLQSAMVGAAKTIVYGGPIHAGWVVGLKKFLKREDRKKNQNVFVFAVGLSPSNSADIERCHKANLNDSNRKIPWFYFMGGLDIDKLKGIEKLIMKMVLRAEAKTKRKEALKAGKPVEQIAGYPILDYCDRAAIKPLLEAIKAAA